MMMAALNESGEAPDSADELSPLSDGKYQVERILAQDEGDGGIIYLVKWEGYDDEQCTWELAESFDSPTTISVWQKQLARGDVPSDDKIDEILARMEAFRARQEELAQQEEAMSKNMSENAVRRRPQPNASRRGSDDASQSILSLEPLTIAASMTPSKAASHQGSDATAWATAPSKASPSSPQPNQVPRLRKRRLSSVDVDERPSKRQPVARSRRMSTKHNQAPPPIGLIRPSEIGHREPGHSLPSVPTSRQSDLFLPSRDSYQTNTRREPVEPSASHYKPHPIPTRPALQDSAPEDPRTPADMPTGIEPNRGPGSRDLIFHLTVGSRPFGLVAVRGFPAWLCKSLKNLRVEKKLELHFQPDFIVSWQEYQQVSAGWLPPSPILDGCGIVRPFSPGIIVDAIQDLVRYFQEMDRGAIWVHPDPKETYALVLHASTMPHWRSKNQCETDKPAHLVMGVRNRVGKGQIPEPLTIPSIRRGRARSISPPPRRQRRPPPPRPDSPPPRNGDHAPENRQKQLNMPVHSHTKRQHIPPSSERNEKATEQRSTAETTGERVAVSSHVPHKGQASDLSKGRTAEKWDATIPSIPTEAKVSSVAVGVCDLDYRSMTSWTASARPIVYIAFGSRYPREAQEVAKWASQYTSSRFVFIGGQADDDKEWEEFRKTCGSNPALLLFSDEPAFCNLPGFGTLLGTYPPATFLCFRLTWQQQQQQQQQQQTPDTPQLPLYTQTKIFSQGTVVLLTEAAMKHHTAESAKVLKWFKTSSAGKSDRWMIMVRPKVRAWLTQQAIRDAAAAASPNNGGSGSPRNAADAGESHDSSQHYVSMLASLSELMPVVDVTEDEVTKLGSLDKVLALTSKSHGNYVVPLPRSIAGYDTSPAAATDAEQMRQRDAILTAHYVGWSAMQAEHHRKFLVIDDLDSARAREQAPQGRGHAAAADTKPSDTSNNAHHLVFMDAVAFLASIERRGSQQHKKTR